jgi:choline dehydrogenase-like flavoprotein
MAAKYELNDDSVVVIVGSGAGGGTLANELTQKGIKVVVLEAGKRHEIGDFVNDEWDSFTQLAWSDMRTTSGSWRVHRDFPNLPAWIVKAVGGSTVHWAGASPALPGARVQSAKRLRDHSGRQSARLADYPSRARALLRQSRGQIRRDAHQRYPGAARQQQF